MSQRLNTLIYILAHEGVTQHYYHYSRGSQPFPVIADWTSEEWFPTLAIILLSIPNTEVNRSQRTLRNKNVSPTDSGKSVKKNHVVKGKYNLALKIYLTRKYES